MHVEALNYQNLTGILARYTDKGRTESANFLNWFLENIYRLDSVAADDAICDEYNDKGIDGIYVDNNSSEVHLFQSKLSQKVGRTIGDKSLKEFAGALEQFRTPENIDAMLKGSANNDLKKILRRTDMRGLVDKGYEVRGVYIANAERDLNTIEIEKALDFISVYSATDIVSNFIEFDADEGVKGAFELDTSYAGIIEI